MDVGIVIDEVEKRVDAEKKHRKGNVEELRPIRKQPQIHEEQHITGVAKVNQKPAPRVAHGIVKHTDANEDGELHSVNPGQGEWVHEHNVSREQSVENCQQIGQLVTEANASRCIQGLST